MCETCGCGSTGHQILTGHSGGFRPVQEDSRISLSGLSLAKEIRVAQDVLGSNDRLAAENRKLFNEKGILALNLVGSPGSGKTTLIVKTIEALAGEMAIYVIEGDQYGSLDSERIAATGTAVVQINTGNGCHLDASGVGQAIGRLEPAPGSLLIIENVGNLVCPALFDLGEHQRVVILSVTEGDDKPVKYAPMFHGSPVCVINKTDLLQYVGFDLAKARENLHKINHHMQIVELSATTLEGLDRWLELIRWGLKNLQA